MQVSTTTTKKQQQHTRFEAPLRTTTTVNEEYHLVDDIHVEDEIDRTTQMNQMISNL